MSLSLMLYLVMATKFAWKHIARHINNQILMMTFMQKPNQTTSQIQSANKGKMLKRWQSDPTQSSGNSSISKKVLCVL